MKVYPYGLDGPFAEVQEIKGVVHVNWDKADANPGDVVNAAIVSGHIVPDPAACAKSIKPETVRGGWSFLPPGKACYTQETAVNPVRTLQTNDYEFSPLPAILVAGALITVGIIYLKNKFEKPANSDRSIDFMPETSKPDWKINPDVVPVQIIPIPGHASHYVEEHMVAQSQNSCAWIFPARTIAHCRTINGSIFEGGEPEELPKEIVAEGQTILKDLADARDAGNAQAAQDLLGYELW